MNDKGHKTSDPHYAFQELFFPKKEIELCDPKTY